MHKLSLRDIKPTAMRLLILRTMMEMKRAVSVTDLEDKLDTVDKSTIFRTLTLFLSHHLIHGVDDGSGSLKYAVCEDCCMCTVEDQHMHFYCEQCHKTYCIRSVHAPTVNLRKVYADRYKLRYQGYLRRLCSPPENRHRRIRKIL